MAPSWITIVYVFQNGSLKERWKRASQIRRCAVELIGKNSVTPSTIPRMTDRRKSFTILVISYRLSVIGYQLSVIERLDVTGQVSSHKSAVTSQRSQVRWEGGAPAT